MTELNELQRIYHSVAPLHGSVLAALEEVARHVLADADHWRAALGMDALPAVAGHWMIDTSAEYSPLVCRFCHTLLDNSGIACCDLAYRAFHSVSRPPYEQGRSVLEQRLAGTGLSASEGEE